MRSLIIVITLAIACSVHGEPTTTRVPKLVAQLGSANYQERESAYRALDELGQACLSDLRAATTSPDSEVSRRAAELVSRIEQRVIAAERLAPTKVNVDNIENRSVIDAITIFNGRTKLFVTVPPNVDKSKLKERKLTFSTNGEVPIWVALDQFLQAAKLTEWDGITPGIPGMPIPTVQAENGQWVQIGRAKVQMRGNVRADVAPPKEIFVYEGAPTSAPTIQSGAVRVRLLPPTTQIPNVMPDADEFVVPMQVTAEPKLSWHGNPTVKLAQAIDHRGQQLTASVIGSAGNRDQFDDFGFNPFMFRDPFSAIPVNPQRSQYLALRFRRGAESFKSLKELNGTLSLPFRIDGELLSLPEPMKSVNKPARSNVGANMVLSSAERTNAGEFKMEISLDLPDEVRPANFNWNQALAGAQIQGGGFGNIQATVTNVPLRSNTTEHLGISVLGADGKRLTLKNARDETVSQGSDGMKIKMTLFCNLPKDAPEPSRIIFRASYPTSVEVGFAFKDVAIQ